ncbi:hypothetical protein HGO92_02845 [Arthrobacter sp. SF27]|nr:beta family protein [Arthrobacter sp. SF27]NMR28645.1 hypothetical protein [Arthrobacter sp. SF27]
MQYVPILKAKQGELSALQSWRDSDFPNTTPLVEVVPWERDDDIDGDDGGEIRKAVSRIGKSWAGKRATMLLDAASAERDPENGWESSARTPVLSEMLRQLRRELVNVAPVVRVSAGDAYTRRLADIHYESPMERGAIRITAEDLDDTATPLGDLALRVADNIRIHPRKLDIILDFGAVNDDATAAMAARLARFVLPQLADGTWRSIVVASGAFPVNLSEVSPNKVAELERFDLRLWHSLQTFKIGTQIHFGDYAVTHPLIPVGVPFAAAPQLRYTLEDRWLVAKGRRQDRRGHAQFFDICAEVLRQAGRSAPDYDVSWGDERIHQAARQAVNPLPELERLAPSSPVGPGNASTWRAIATSHHMAYVSRRLSETGAP